MAEIPNVRRLSDVLIHLRLKDNGVAVDFTSLSDIRTIAYSDSQKAVAGSCPCEIDEEDHTILNVRYNVDVHQYLGIAKIILRCTYLGRTKTYDVPVLNFVDTTAEATGVLVLPDPEISVELEVADVSTSLLDDAINAAFAAAELANLKADEASSAAAGADEAATLAREKAQAANSAAGRANSSATNANNAAAAAVAATESIQELETTIEEAEAAREERADEDHERAETDHGIAVDDHTQAGSDHTRAESDHSTASDDHTQAGTDHGRAADDHSTASSDHTRAESDHTTAASDHSTASSDHETAVADHAIVQGYDTRLTNVEGEVEDFIGYDVTRTYTPGPNRLNVVFDKPIRGGYIYRVTYVSSTDSAVSLIRVYRRQGTTVIGSYTNLSIGGSVLLNPIEANADNLWFYTQGAISTGIDIVIRVECLGEARDGEFSIKDGTVPVGKIKSSDINATPTEDSTKLVTSGGVYSFVKGITEPLDERVTAIENAESPLAGKKVVSFGDSIWEFYDSNGKGIVEYLQDISGNTDIYKGAIGGSRLKPRRASVANPTDAIAAYGNLDIYNLVNAWVNNDWTNVDAAVLWLKNNTADDNTDIINNLKACPVGNTDIVLIAGGTNDSKNGVALGTKTSNDTTTTCGSLALCIHLILSANPKIKIFQMSPIVRYVENTTPPDEQYWSDVWQNASNVTLADCAEALRETAKYHHIPSCDLYWELGWNQDNFLEFFNASDLTHPYKGFRRIAEKVYTYLNSHL